MFPMRSWVVGLCTALAPVVACAELVIAGGVFEDPAALAVRSGFTGIASVTVRLYQDGARSAFTTTTTDTAGMYVFDGLTPGEYWVTVDSKTIGPSRDAWAEQTFGPAGALCAGPDGPSSPMWFEGPCFSGRTAKSSDDASAIATSEHVARISLRDSATGVDFAFSFDAVTNTADGDRVQGSLRQFVRNANAIPGPNRMRFVPVERAPERRDSAMGVPPRWWTIHLTAPLPPLTDADTLVDGTAFHFRSPASIADVHPGRHGEPPTIKPDDEVIPRLEKPELEVTLTGAEGVVCASRCVIRDLALLGAPTSVIARADARLEHLLIGAAPDATPAATFGSVGLQVESGTVTARHLLVTAQTRAGILVARGAKLDGERLEVSRCGDPATGGAIVLLSDGSSIRASTIAANGGAGILLGSPDGSAPASANTIDGCTISGNQAGVVIAPGSSRNVVTRNDLMWNTLAAVTVAPFGTAAAAPRENRVSANRFNENGLRPLVLDLDASPPGSGTCERISGAANDGIAAPEVTGVQVLRDSSALRVTLRGRSCPGHVVELYDSTTGFNYLGTTSTAADGTFEASFPLPTATPLTERSATSSEETDVWAREVLKIEDRAFTALAIDTSGNTSEMSAERKVE